MKRFLILAAALLFMAGPSVLAEKVYVTKNIEISEYTSVECNIPCDIEYVQGPASFKVSATQDIINHLVAAVSEGKLKICFDKTKIFNTGGIKLWISSSQIESVSINGAIDFNADKGIVADSFTATLNGASELEIEGLKAANASITANGTASMDIEGAECGNMEVKINGAGDCELERVICDTLEVSVNGAGSSKIEGHAKEARLTVNGVGGIDAKNLTADTMNTAVNGIGKISRN